MNQSLGFRSCIPQHLRGGPGSPYMMKKNELNVMIELFKTNVMTNKSKSHDAVNFYERSTTVRPQVVFPQVVFHLMVYGELY